ncbi:exopolyphosphatase [Geobacter sp.]|uniref:Ppx/GppA phosphatase family protein n=1 Tax=Geobacter sp. TaxID=46610 RepID=UPI002608AD7C|nr:exopolyphosphatase [Geobacter sp.]
MSQPPFASIDLGTNTARLLIGRVEGGEVVPLVVRRRITRLGGGFTRERGISDEAWERSRDALIDFADEMNRAGVVRSRAVATSAVRDAVNGPAFCADILERTGIRLEVIDGREEGLLTLEGVLSGLDRKGGDFCVFDVGGGSTEYTLAVGDSPLFTESLPLGVVRLTEGKPDLASMEDKIVRELGRVRSKIVAAGLGERLGRATLVGTAGTATTLAAISLGMEEYDYRRVNNYVLPVGEIRDILALLAPLSPAERLKVPGLEKGREDLIIAGTLITLKTMELFGFEEMKVSDFGLLEGVLLNMAKTGGGVRTSR